MRDFPWLKGDWVGKESMTRVDSQLEDARVIPIAKQQKGGGPRRGGHRKDKQQASS